MTSSDTLRAVARFGLGDTETVEIGPVDASRWSEVLNGIVSQRLGGHAVAAAYSGAFELAPVQLDQLMTHHEEQLAIDLRIEQMLVESDAALGAAGIETRVLKGPAVAHRFYDDPSLRSFGDADILVRGADMDATIATLAEAGLDRRFEAPRRSFDRRFVKAVSLVAENGMELDVHRALTPGPFGVLFDVDEIFATPPDRVEVGGRELRCLAPELAFVHACAHAALGDSEPRFVPLRDIAELIRRPLEAALTRSFFERCRAEVVAHRAVELVEQQLGIELSGGLASWARQFVPKSRDRSRMSSYSGENSRYAAQAAATFWVLPSQRERFAYASALAFPGRDYLKSHDQSYSRRFVRGASLVLRWRPR